MHELYSKLDTARICFRVGAITVGTQLLKECLGIANKSYPQAKGSIMRMINLANKAKRERDNVTV
jgi:hypothetical protein